jgi:hypothetical protein
MSEFDSTADTADFDNSSLSDTAAPQWGPGAPRGAKTVLNRIVKDGANVPLFLGQTLVNSLRDTGYNNTTSAVCEHVDNSIESGATEVRVYFIESGPKQRRTFHVLVMDNGKGMPPNVLKAACAFGGSMRFDSRGGIGRYGMGMKAAALSMSPTLDVYTWQEPGAYYNITIDVDAIGQDKSNVIFVPEPQLMDMLPSEITLALNTPMVYPKNPGESQDLFCRDASELREKLGEHGTIIFMPDCDRLTHRKVSTLVDHATREMSRVYRRQLDRGLKLLINNREVEPFDPTYQMKTARHNRIPELFNREKSSRLLNRWEVPIPVAEGDEMNKRNATVRLYFLPIADWSALPRKVLKNDLKVFDTGGISFMRGDREVDIKGMEGIVGKRSTRDSWWRIEVDFHGDLDEAFGVAMNKQGVRPKAYVQELIREKILEDLREVRKAVEQHWSEQAALESQNHVSAAEQRANEMEALQSTLLPRPAPKDEAEQKQLDDNLRALSVNLKREGETDEQAFDRVKGSQFITTYTHNDDAPFYRADFKLGKVIMTINTAHSFYEKLYRPLATVAKKVTESKRADGGDDDEQTFDAAVVEDVSQVLTSLQLFLLSLARTQGEMTANDAGGDTQKLFDRLRKQWSMNLETQLTTP